MCVTTGRVAWRKPCPSRAAMCHNWLETLLGPAFDALQHLIRNWRLANQLGCLFAVFSLGGLLWLLVAAVGGKVNSGLAAGGCVEDSQRPGSSEPQFASGSAAGPMSSTARSGIALCGLISVLILFAAGSSDSSPSFTITHYLDSTANSRVTSKPVFPPVGV